MTSLESQVDMTPLDRLRLEKAAADCGFEMTSVTNEDGLTFRSARFPETVLVRPVGAERFELRASDASVIEPRDSNGLLSVEGFGSLYTVLRTMAAHARTRPNRVADEFKKQTAAMPKGTEAERLVVQRVGQGLFRSALLDFWQGRCCITGLDVPELLRASHIRPWAKCVTDEQRLDVFNGLLLAPHLDALFDAGFMTVEDDGAVRLAASLGMSQRQQLGLTGKLVVHALRAEHLKYVGFHRHAVWRD
ncbi:MAG: HNH endonuclease [Rubrivivax sp.]|nr:HNH endonuclease [Rubrivivax sp.]